MPIERKILIFILISIILLFSGYLIYDGYIKSYFDTSDKIEKYKILIDKVSEPNNEITELQIEELTTLIERYNGMFFYEADREITNLTPHIKQVIIDSGMDISQYQGLGNSVQFSIKGNKTSLANFLYILYSESRIYDIPLLNIRMINNYEFQGIIEISRPELKAEPNAKYYKEFPRLEIESIPYISDLFNFLGTSLFEATSTDIPVVMKIEVKKVKNKTTNKFSFIGCLKKNGETITMFKESKNGRIFRFKELETISEWTYLGLESDTYMFSKDKIIYEVTP
ncbi:MAG: hypothetical protein OCD02_10400 [Spirochaetaceae bacterium]